MTSARDQFAADQRRIDRPKPGYYRMRVRSGGAWVPALIYKGARP